MSERDSLALWSRHLESRMATEMTRLIEHYGGQPLVAPALREIPIQDNPAALRFGTRLIDGQVDILILMTGIGTTILFEILRSRHPMSSIMAGLKQDSNRRSWPQTGGGTQDPWHHTDSHRAGTEHMGGGGLHARRVQWPVKGLRVAVQEYGMSNPELLEALRQRGAEVFPVPIYRWALPESTGPLKQVLGEIIAGNIQVMLVTNAAQIDHVDAITPAGRHNRAVQRGVQKDGRRVNRPHRQRTPPPLRSPH